MTCDINDIVCDNYMYVCPVESNAGGRVIEMTGAAKCISYYGIADLNEVLSSIQLNGSCDLSACRSVKVRHYLQVVHCQSHIMFLLLVV